MRNTTVKVYKYLIKGYAQNPSINNARFIYDLTIDTDSILNCASFPQMLINLALKTKKEQGQFVDPNTIVIEKMELLQVVDISNDEWDKVASV